MNIHVRKIKVQCGLPSGKARTSIESYKGRSKTSELCTKQ